MTENPDWLRLIRHWVIGGVHYGYSFPFLMGARAKKNRLDKITQKDTQLLIDEIFFHPVSGNIIQVIFCPELYIPVFGIYRNEKDVPGIFFPNTIQPSVFVQQHLINTWGNSIEKVIDSILAESEKPIQEGLFSRTVDRKWAKFSDEENDRINRILEVV